MIFKKPKPTLCDRVNNHFQADPATLTIIEQSYPAYNRANVHLALEELLGGSDVLSELLGYSLSEDYNSVTLSKLTRPESSGHVNEGPVELRIPSTLNWKAVNRTNRIHRCCESKE